MTDEHEPYTTRSGRVLSDDEIVALAGEAERDPDIDALATRRPGRPRLGSGPAEAMPVRREQS